MVAGATQRLAPMIWACGHHWIPHRRRQGSVGPGKLTRTHALAPHLPGMHQLAAWSIRCSRTCARWPG